jgi:hypothetical protein
MNPPIPPPIWAPRFRAWLIQVFAWLDARKGRREAFQTQQLDDRQWQAAYQVWWHDHGWEQGADTPTAALDKIRRQRMYGQ